MPRKANCKFCHQAFSAHSARHYYCSLACRVKNWRNDNREKYNSGRRQSYKISGKFSRIRRVYGLDKNEYSKSSECSICHLELTNDDKNVDHCHKKGATRGILCCNCNWLLGNCKNDIKILKSAIAYLKKASITSNVSKGVS